jgi:SAM-dependent methyltransferase
MITQDDLDKAFHERYGQPHELGPLPKRMFKFKYFPPDVYYEAIINKLVKPGCMWLDVGGGRNVLPYNISLTQKLAERCETLVAIDPSINILENKFAHKRVQSTIENYRDDKLYDLITMRMVAEHISQPQMAVTAMSRLLKPNGNIVIYTINKFALVSIFTWIIPFKLHHPIKRILWQTEQKDTFPVMYRMNTRYTLHKLITEAGLTEDLFIYLDDCLVFQRIGWLNSIELNLRWLLRRASLFYPETCLLGVYKRK